MRRRVRVGRSPNRILRPRSPDDMLRRTFLYLSSQPRLFHFVRHNGMAKRFASRFVAGETLDSALAAVRQLNARKIRASLDLLGESVTTEAEARAASRSYLGMLDRINQA